MTGTTNDGAGRPRLRTGETGRRHGSVPPQRTSGGSRVRELLVGADDSDESLDEVVTAAREAQAAGVALRLRASPEVTAHGEEVARERVAHRLQLAAEMARALCPGLEVTVASGQEGDQAG
jgi:hypothetical protein